MRRLLFASLALIVGACAAEVDPVSRASEEIVNGTRETGHPEVVALYWMSGATEGGLCSGTVIGPYAVLTAKHCVFRDAAGGGEEAVPPSAMVVIVGNDVNTMAGVTSVHRVLEVRTTPGSNIDADVENGNDIAIVLLDAAIPVTPRGTATNGPFTGNALTIVGFGRTGSGSAGSGVKYRGVTTTERVGALLFETNGTGMAWTCQGDSGGPAIDPAGNVTGITSFGFGDCVYPYSYFTRVAGHRALIDAALTFVPPCVPRAELCNGIDEDCDDAIDETGCTEVGQPCDSNSDCVEGACEDVGGASVCAVTCFPDDPAVAPCPSGTFCEATDCGQGRCVSGTLGTGAEGAECVAHTDCASGSCTLVAGAMRCGRQCFPDTGCPGGEVCELTAAECGACVPADVAMTPRSFGQACTEDVQCESGECAPEGFCTTTCRTHADCPADHHCSA
ncbi:MAG: trypsin-like serine protease, partial [Myxococcota bacterium]|nr:trypsin-like serine protease [Myxococcota bacterium]